MDNRIYTVLPHLRSGPMSVKALRETSGIPERSLDRYLRQLRAAGYVAAEADATNRRRMLHRLTDRGAGVVGRAGTNNRCLASVLTTPSDRTLKAWAIADRTGKKLNARGTRIQTTKRPPLSQTSL